MPLPPPREPRHPPARGIAYRANMVKFPLLEHCELNKNQQVAKNMRKAVCRLLSCHSLR